MADVPEDLDLSRERRSRDGRYRGRLTSEAVPPPLDALHRWKLVIEDASGAAATDIRLRLDGGMPQHSHGLPTQPLVSPGDTPGTYVVEGVRFHMRGWWQLVFSIDDGSGAQDLLTFDLVLG